MSDSLYSDYYYVKVEARCEIKGTAFPISSFSLTYALNSIPEAVLELPIGRVAGGAQFNAVSSAMAFLLTLGPFAPVKVFATFTASPGGRASPTTPGFPDGKEFLVFDGFVKTPGSANTFNSASIRLVCMGKSAALVGSTQMINGAVSVFPPNGASEAVSFFGGDQGTVQATLQNAIQERLGGSTDLWNGVLQPMMEVSLEEVDAWNQASDPEAAQDSGNNNFAQQALDRINVFNALPEAGIVIASNAATPIANQPILATVLECFYDAWSGDLSGNLWQVLMTLSAVFGFKYVTAIEEDALLPVTYGLGGEPWVTIDPSEYNSISVVEQGDPSFFSYVTKVGIFSTAFQSSPWQGETASIPLIGLASLDGENDLGGSGQLVLIPAPTWLLPPAVSGSTTLLPGGAVPDASNPTDVQAPPPPPEIAFLDEALGDEYASACLQDMLFKHRRLQLSGRVRFDVAPGSLIKIVTVGDRFTGKDAVLFGHVAGATIEVSMAGDSGYARTSFAVTNVRTEEEHKTLTVDKHPLFDEAWVGGKLSEEA